MKTNTTPAVVSNTATPATVVPGGFTLGLDLGDRRHHVCVLDAAGQILREGALTNTRPALTQLLADYEPRATVALEAGTHSPWISRFLQERGATVLVANPRKLHAISRHERKCDRRDAQMLARLARGDLTRHGARVCDSRIPWAGSLSSPLGAGGQGCSVAFAVMVNVKLVVGNGLALRRPWLADACPRTSRLVSEFYRRLSASIGVLVLVRRPTAHPAYAARKRSTSIAAAHPIPAAVIACR